jgi:hypothetical protein
VTLPEAAALAVSARLDWGGDGEDVRCRD